MVSLCPNRGYFPIFPSSLCCCTGEVPWPPHGPRVANSGSNPLLPGSRWQVERPHPPTPGHSMVGGGQGGVNSRWYHTSPPIAARAAASLAPNPTAGNPSVRLRVRRRRPTPALSQRQWPGLRRGHRGARCRLCFRPLGGLPRIEERVLVPQRLSSAETHREARRPDALWDVRAMVGGPGEGNAVTPTPPREGPTLPPWALPP